MSPNGRVYARRKVFAKRQRFPGDTTMSALPPHFFVWLLYMHMSGTAVPIAGFKNEAMCVQTRDGMTAKSNSTVKYKCDKFAIER